MRKDDLLKCLENLEVDSETATRFADSLQHAFEQMQCGGVRISHPSLLKFRYLLEEMFSKLTGEYHKILTSASYSTPRAQAFQDLGDALQIQIDQTKRLLLKEE